jgi:hypothetical protein
VGPKAGVDGKPQPERERRRDDHSAGAAEERAVTHHRARLLSPLTGNKIEPVLTRRRATI